MTNFEKIKNMNVNEMADILDKGFNCYGCPIREFCDKNKKNTTCKTVLKKWLKSEVQNNDISKS